MPGQREGCSLSELYAPADQDPATQFFVYGRCSATGHSAVYGKGKCQIARCQSLARATKLGGVGEVSGASCSAIWQSVDSTGITDGPELGVSNGASYANGLNRR